VSASTQPLGSGSANDGFAGAMLSIVIPTYNEQDNVRRVYERLSQIMAKLDVDWELIFSVDPCTDATEELIRELCETDPRVKMLRFSRRFGQPMATIAGLEAASGDAVVVIDCDLQDPPELIPELLARWREGYDVVYAQRRTRAGETIPKRVVAGVGYRVIRRVADVDIPPNTGDFRLMSRRVVDNVVSLQESHGFLRGLVGLVGFRQTSVPYDRDPRVAGTSKYNRFWGSLVIGLNGVVGFSRYPLQLISILGFGISALGFLLAIVYLGLKLGGLNFPVGNPTIVIVVAFFSGIQLLSLGVIGEYVGRIYDESRHRPKYIVESRCGWEDQRVRDLRPRTHELPPVCILAGGLGTRLGERVRDTPKPLLPVAGEPFLIHQLRLLAGHGVREVVLCVGYRGEQIEGLIGSERFGVGIRYSFDAVPGLDGTLGAIRRALPLLGERFLVLYGDTYLRIDYGAVVRRWRESGLPAVMTVLRNEGRWDTSNVVYRDGMVLRHDKRSPTPEMRWIDYGLGGLTVAALERVPASEDDLAVLYGRLAERGELLGYEASERFYEIGTTPALIETEAFLVGRAADS
jgi:dolichol-phosphate mannosyltransferase